MSSVRCRYSGSFLLSSVANISLSLFSSRGSQQREEGGQNLLKTKQNIKSIQHVIEVRGTLDMIVNAAVSEKILKSYEAFEM